MCSAAVNRRLYSPNRNSPLPSDSTCPKTAPPSRRGTRGNRRIGKTFPDAINDLEELCAGVAPSHRVKYGILSELEGDVCFGHCVDDAEAHVAGVGGDEAEAFEVWD